MGQHVCSQTGQCTGRRCQISVELKATGSRPHELLAFPHGPVNQQPGARAVGADDRSAKTELSVVKCSRYARPIPGSTGRQRRRDSTSWKLAAGRYEIVCNPPGPTTTFLATS